MDTVMPLIFSPAFNVIPFLAALEAAAARSAAPPAFVGADVKAGEVIDFTYQFSFGRRGSRK